MISQFIKNLTTPKYDLQSAQKALTVPQIVPPPKQVTLYLKGLIENKNACMIKEGDSVKTGQKLMLEESSDTYAISSVTGTISASKWPAAMACSARRYDSAA